MSQYDYTFKILVLGDNPARKTAFTKRYISGYYQEDIKLTIGVDFYSKTTTFKDKKIKIQLWDFGGEEKFRFLLPEYCKGASGAFFLYDITHYGSFKHISEWLKIIRENTGDIPIILIGSKLDLHENRVVSRDEGLLAAEKYNLASFLEVSSKTGENVEKAFEIMIEKLIERYP